MAWDLCWWRLFVRREPLLMHDAAQSSGLRVWSERSLGGDSAGLISGLILLRSLSPLLDANMAEHVLPDEFRCSYPFKFCNNHRALKKSGQRHKMCQEHRDKANKHQQDLARRRKQIKERLARTANRQDAPDGIDERLAFADISDLLNDSTFLRVDCNEDDLRAVDTLLSDSNSDDQSE